MSIEFFDVMKRFGDHEVLRGARWNVPTRACGVILGANGTGKSTLLRILVSLAVPDSGTTRLAGATTPLQRRRVTGFVGHTPPLTPALSVEDNLRFRARLAGVPSEGAALDEWLGLYDLAPMREKLARSLSRGQAQRVALASVEIGAAPVVLLDEPFTGLDVEHSERLAGRIQAWREAGRTVLLTTHDVARGLDVADCVAVLTAGKVFEVPQEERRAPDALQRLHRVLAG